jgi:hypothetical protein
MARECFQTIGGCAAAAEADADGEPDADAEGCPAAEGVNAAIRVAANIARRFNMVLFRTA